MPSVFWVVLFVALYSSLFEYLVHRFVDHRRVRVLGFELPVMARLYEAHHVEHHGDYSATKGYHYTGHARPFARMDWSYLPWCHAPLLPIYPLLWHYTPWWNVLAAALYVSIYYAWFLSGLHYTVHHPDRARWDRWSFIRWLNRHHWLHHKHPKRNFSFTFPVWDLVFRTYHQPTLEDDAQFAEVLAEVAQHAT